MLCVKVAQKEISKIVDEIKIYTMENVFVYSKLLLIYGAAGTGKTKLINYISTLMSQAYQNPCHLWSLFIGVVSQIATKQGKHWHTQHQKSLDGGVHLVEVQQQHRPHQHRQGGNHSHPLKFLLTHHCIFSICSMMSRSLLKRGILRCPPSLPVAPSHRSNSPSLATTKVGASRKMSQHLHVD